MNEIENNVQKPKLCRLAVLSPTLDILGILFLCIGINEGISEFVTFLIFGIFSFFGMVVGLLACYKIYISHGKLKGLIIALLGMVVGIILVFFISFVKSLVMTI